MVSDTQWMFITNKYSLIDYLDNAILIARFNQNDLRNDLIKLRSELISYKSYDALKTILEKLLLLGKNVSDERLANVLKDLIEQMRVLVTDALEIENNCKESETEAFE